MCGYIKKGELESNYGKPSRSLVEKYLQIIDQHFRSESIIRRRCTYLLPSCYQKTSKEKVTRLLLLIRYRASGRIRNLTRGNSFVQLQITTEVGFDTYIGERKKKDDIL